MSADSVVIYQLSKNNVLKEFFLINDHFSSGKQIQFQATSAERPNIPVLKYDKVSKTLWIVDKAGLLYSYKKGIPKKQDLKYLQGLQPGPDGKLYYIDEGSLYCMGNNQTKLLIRDVFKDALPDMRLDLAIDKTGNIVVSYLNANRAKLF